MAPSADELERNRELLRDDAWRLSLGSFAFVASQRWSNKGTMIQGWKPYAWLRYVARIIEREVRKGGARIILNAPPRSGKSELVCHWLPTWFLELWPEKNVISTAYGDALAHDWGRKVRDEFLTNELLLTRLRDDAQAVSKWLTTEGGGMLSAGVGGPILGKGGDLMLVDDPHKNFEEASSKTKREELQTWFKGTFWSRKEPGASVIVMHQRFVENDLTGFVLKELTGENWIHINLPALAEENDPLGRAVGEALVPERQKAEELAKIKVVQGSMLFSGMYQQRPIPLEGGIIKNDWLRYWDPATIPFDTTGEWLMSWDMSFKETTDGSYVVGQVWRKLGSRHILMDQRRERMDFPSAIGAILAMIQKWPHVLTKLIEEKANGSATLSVLRNKVPGLIATNPDASKEARLSAVSPLFEAGNVELPPVHMHPWVGDYVQELCTFPNSEHDDQVDATSQALDRWVPKGANMDEIILPMMIGTKPGIIGMGGM